MRYCAPVWRGGGAVLPITAEMGVAALYPSCTPIIVVKQGFQDGVAKLELRDQ